MAEYKEILYEKKRGGVLITLNRPEAMNAISRTLIKELHQALDEVETDPEIRAVVITGAGRAFSAGMDQGKTASGRRRDLHWPYGRAPARGLRCLRILPSLPKTPCLLSPRCATAPIRVSCGPCLVDLKTLCATA